MKTYLLRDLKAVEPQTPAPAAAQPGGLPEGSRGLSAAIPPDRGANGSAPWKGARLRRGRSSRLSASGTPAGVQRILQHRIRGCHCAQPPATFCHPSGMKHGSVTSPRARNSRGDGHPAPKLRRTGQKTVGARGGTGRSPRRRVTRSVPRLPIDPRAERGWVARRLHSSHRPKAIYKEAQKK